jgi:IS5 family transposase
LVRYTSPLQGQLFTTPFEQSLDFTNRWIKLAHQLDWDILVKEYHKSFNPDFGAPAVNARVVIGAVIIKHLLHLSDEDTISTIQENLYMQYFLGLSSFQTEAVFAPSLFVLIRTRLSLSFWEKVTRDFVQKAQGVLQSEPSTDASIKSSTGTKEIENNNDNDNKTISQGGIEEQGHFPNQQIIEQSLQQQPDDQNKGDLLIDATVAEQDIRYPTDLDLLNDSREKLEEIIDCFCETANTVKPRTYPQNARKDYLHTARSKKCSAKQIRKAVGKQLNYIRRDLKCIDRLMPFGQSMQQTGISFKQLQYLMIIRTLYAQQREMHTQRIHRCDHRIVSIHQPHVRPMVRGKAGSNVEFGSKIGLSLYNGYALIDTLCWDNYNEGTDLSKAAENYRQTYGHYPAKIIADRKYCTKDNRDWCKENGIYLSGKPLGRPSAKTKQQQKELKKDASQRNAIEGKFGQGKRKYGLDYIFAKLKDTSESWIGAIVFVLNIVRWEHLFCLIFFRCQDLIEQITGINERNVTCLRYEMTSTKKLYNQAHLN